MRRLIETECRQVYELQHTHKQSRSRKAAAPATPGSKKMVWGRPGTVVFLSPRQGGGMGAAPPTRERGGDSASAQRHTPSPWQGGEEVGSAKNNTKRLQHARSSKFNALHVAH